MPAVPVAIIEVRSRPGERDGAILSYGDTRLPARIGRAGITRFKREGDGATPAGPLRPLAALYRADRERPPATCLPLTSIMPDDLWCDDPAAPAYNRPVKAPFGPSAERLWREDALYDLLVVLDWNWQPVKPGRGSAIFLHVAPHGPTAGCIALAKPALRRLLARIGPETVIQVGE